MSALLWFGIVLLILALLEVSYFALLLVIQLAGNVQSPWADAFYFWRAMPTPWRYFLRSHP